MKNSKTQIKSRHVFNNFIELIKTLKQIKILFVFNLNVFKFQNTQKTLPTLLQKRRKNISLMHCHAVKPFFKTPSPLAFYCTKSYQSHLYALVKY